jgi:dihydroorotate dehydrogenase
MFSVAKRVLFALDPETAHNATLSMLHLGRRLGVLATTPMTSSGKITLAGLSFPNRVGLAGGMDKNGVLLDSWAHFGFGFAELGTVTPRPQSGNEKPRMFRLLPDQAIINRMGFNNLGIEHLVEQFKKRNHNGFILGANLGKNKVTANEDAEADYIEGMRKLYLYADYFTINISSPNTPGLRELQDAHRIKSLVHTLCMVRDELPIKRPVFIKLDPDTDSTDLPYILEAILQAGADGIIATNTTTHRPNQLKSPQAKQAGGLSGEPLFEIALKRVAEIRAFTGSGFPLMGVGGINSVQRGQHMLEAGADLIQVYSGFVFKGPTLIKDLALSLPKTKTS